MSAPTLDESPDTLTENERALWLLQRVHPTNAAYVLSGAFRTGSDLDVAALRAAIGALAERHPSLRTSYPTGADGTPRRVVHDSIELDWHEDDPSEFAALELQARLEEEARRTFDLTTAPLFRVRIYRLSEAAAVIQFTLHHILADFSSAAVLAQDLGRLYRAKRLALPLPPPPSAPSYAEFALQQRRMLAASEGERLRRYWELTLEDATAGAQPAVASSTVAVDGAAPGSTVRFELDPALGEQVRRVARESRTSAFAVLLAALAAVLERHTGESSQLIATPFVGRSPARFSAAVGYFVNTVLVQAELGGRPSFRDVAARTHSSLRGALDHASYPFPLAVSASGSRGAAVEVAAALLQDRADAPVGFAAAVVGAQDVVLDLDGLELRRLPLDGTPPQFSLTLLLGERPDGGYAAQVQRTAVGGTLVDASVLAAGFVRLLRAAVSHPDRPVADLPLLDVAAEETLLTAWSGADAHSPAYRSLQAVVAEHARLTPHRVAVEHGGDMLTFAELEARSNRLARWLRRAGVADEALVAQCLDRSVDMIVGLLGVFKAGGAYVPLDPAYPAARLAFLLQDARADVLLTHKRLAPRLASSPARVVCLDAGPDADAIRAESDTPLGHEAHPDNLAYVIYTSGSTGTPKGAMNTHGGYAASCEAGRATLGIGPDDRVLQLVSPSFDVSLWEAGIALRAGATLCIADQDDLLPGAPLTRTLRDRAITAFVPSPSALSLLDAREPLPALRVIVPSGETCPPELVARWATPSRRLIVGYGPTEVSICSTLALCTPDDTAAPLPIGRPQTGICAYVLDRHLQLLPVGSAGELFVGGALVGRGYLGRPGLTAERFVPDPFSGTAGARMYRTGDRVRWRTDRQLEFLGRLDHQVKVRGFRVEPGEVEAALRAHPSVDDAAVLAHGDAPANRHLAAFVQPRAGAEWLPEALRAHLAERLPEHMVPSRFEPIQARPLTPNGKLDRAMLLSRLKASRGAPRTYVAPRTDTEHSLATLWAELLDVGVVGVTDDFLELGGHSLLAMQMAGRLQHHFGVELPVRALFEANTVERLAREVELLVLAEIEALHEPA